MAGIAISCRREDTGWITGRIFDRLKEHYEKAQKLGYQKKPVVFMDYDSTPVGVDFRDHIKGVLADCDNRRHNKLANCEIAGAADILRDRGESFRK